MDFAKLHLNFDRWFSKNAYAVGRAFAIVFGVIWGIDGVFKFTNGLVDSLPSMISSAAANQPSWLSGWFSFWSAQTAGNPAFWVYLTGALELALAFSLIFGFARKIGYGGGFLLSLFIWAVPEGFGGPYGPGATDIGTGIIYALVFLFLMAWNASAGKNTYTLDRKIEKRFKSWKAIAEIKR